MFASHALPPPSTFGHEHPPLRITSDSARPQPQGGCHYQNSAGQGVRCRCQTYQHNRSLPGNTCDCGHSACYHSQVNDERRLSPDRIVSALAEKVRKLEDIVVKERETRNNMALRERQSWEREVRLLREALVPFYHSESEMKRRLAQLEHRSLNNDEDHFQLKERMSAIEEVNTSLERRMQQPGSSHPRKRKASLDHETVVVMSPESNYTYSSSSIASDTTSISTQRSPQPPSPISLPVPIAMTVASPRSSGVLNLKPKLPPELVYPGQLTQQLDSDIEPRSSGFLSLDLTERLRRHKLSPNPAEVLPGTVSGLNHIYHKSPSTISSGLPSPPHSKIPSRALPVSGLLSTGTRNDKEARSPKRHKQQSDGMLALEILANATVQQPTVH